MSMPPPPEPEAFHQPFSWLPLHYQTDQCAQFYALTVDVCYGIKTCMELVHVSNADRGTDVKPTLDIIDTERLLRLALTSAQMLAETAEHRIDKLDRHVRIGPISAL
ncbi:hypothetical protein QN379_20995 [Glaciimonas sp. Gout2]|uniref:hypothetical protein n=1 Tax=unclassified Glaciimonas TaxID=2644401 RepID=UPI002B234159|nr:MULTISPECIES: hypothetical protein [unclassified Glaciimonas]MEB0014271.1 hypothetical protein [Glaciimonas sp. Cout2]MEB0084491.1 hypothetical protein [Glaciimonas sp. Gout2]